ncbi:MAG: hypothetical protein ABI321_13675, partial [Polyangia bacterium]
MLALRFLSFLGCCALIAGCSDASDGNASDAARSPDASSPNDGSSDAGPDGSLSSGNGYDSLTFGTDGAGIGGAMGAPFTFDAAKRYDGDAAFRKMIANYGQTAGNALVASFDPSKAGTGSAGSALYTDGQNPDLAEWASNAGPQGDPAFVLTIKALDMPSESPTPQLATSAQTKHAVWLWVRRRYDPGYSSYGDADDTNGALTWNRTQGAGLKIGPYASYGYHDSLTGTTYYGRAGLQTGNGTASSTADYDLINLPQGAPQPAGVNDTKIENITTEWTDGIWRDYLVYVGNTLDTDGVIRVAAQVWTRTLGGGGAFVPLGPRLSGVIGPATSFERPRFAEIE